MLKGRALLAVGRSIVFDRFIYLLLAAFIVTACSDDRGGEPQPQPEGQAPPSEGGEPGDGDQSPEPDVPVPLGDLERLYVAINLERAKHALPLIPIDDQLACAADRHASDVGASRSCSHTGSDGSNFVQRASTCGFRIGAGSEILACGHRSPESAVIGWLNSPPHRAAMLEPNNRVMGGAVLNNFWVVVFAK